MILFNQHKIYFFMQNLLISNTEHMNYESKTVPLQIFLIQAPHPKQSQEGS